MVNFVWISAKYSREKISNQLKYLKGEIEQVLPALGIWKTNVSFPFIPNSNYLDWFKTVHRSIPEIPRVTQNMNIHEMHLEMLLILNSAAFFLYKRSRQTWRLTAAETLTIVAYILVTLLSKWQEKQMLAAGA